VSLPKPKLDKEAVYWLVGGLCVCLLLFVGGKGVADGLNNNISPELRASLENRHPPGPPPGAMEAAMRGAGRAAAEARVRRIAMGYKD
jgi:hypothetical protein